MLISTGKLHSPEPGFVSHTPASLEFTKNGSTGIIFRHFFDIHLTGWASWPDFFTKYGSSEPKDETHNPVAFANGVDGQRKYWEIFAGRGGEFMAEFGESMEQLQKVLPITGIYDFTWVGQYARENSKRPLIVDVGGGKGQILHAILAETPDILPARCILQDRADVIQKVEASANDSQTEQFQKMAIDFHKDQPVKGGLQIANQYMCSELILNLGALIYYLRHVIHNYQDSVCIEILKHLSEALPADEPRARVLICEQIMSDVGTPSPVTTAMDMAMVNIGAKERTDSGFERIVTAAGLQLVKCHRQPGHEVGIVECSKRLG